MKVLTIDDDRDMHELYTAALVTDDPDNAVADGIFHAYDGAAGVEMYKSGVPFVGGKFDLVIMDGQMPVMNGYDAISAIIAHDPEARIVLMSWAPDDNDAMARGALGAHVKTFDHDELRRIICSYADSCGLAEPDEDLEDATVSDDGLSGEAEPDDRDASDTGIDLDADARFEAILQPEPEPETIIDPRQLRIDGIRRLCDLMEQNPDVKLPSCFDEARFWLFGEGDEALEKMTTIRRMIGGKWEKSPWQSYFDLVGKIGGVEVKITTERTNVCKRVVVGTHTSVVDIPDPELVAQVPLKRVETTIEDVEWVCPESLVSG